MTAAICVENLSKCYRLSLAADAAQRTLREDLSELGKAPLRRLRREKTPTKRQDFWALRDVSFEVEPGEVVGIVGRNGAGKSTLLKIISRITRPTAGRVRLRGRVGSLLEVGAGFHPELSGSENIFLSGTILGMTRREVASKFDAIAAFADVDPFLDVPVKRYSSGMYVRLAFAVAVHLEPEILILDETLGVGDVAFQARCLEKLQQVVNSGDRAVLIVSHNLQLLPRLTARCLLLDHGRIVATGSPESVIREYQKVLAAPPADVDERIGPRREQESSAVEPDAAAAPVSAATIASSPVVAATSTPVAAVAEVHTDELAHRTFFDSFCRD